MRTKFNRALYDTVRLADAEGVSYGVYTARELGNFRRCVPEKKGAYKRRKSGKTTVREALTVDCPSQCKGEAPEKKGRFYDPLGDAELVGAAVRLYRMGYNAEHIGKRLNEESGSVAGALRRAEKERKKSKRALPPETALEILSMNARGESYGNIARKFGMSLPTVAKFLNGRKEKNEEIYF